MNPFKAYDIRGLYGADIDNTLAFQLGRAVANLYPGIDLIGAYDARVHSKDLLWAFGAGAAQLGIKMIDAGCISTPALHYLQMQHGYQIGVMATASHNPPQYHGFKLFNSSGGSISLNKGLHELETEVAKDLAIMPSEVSALPSLSPTKIDRYIDFATAHVRPEVSGMKIVIDASNGSSGSLVKAAVKRLKLRASILNDKPDGTFPAHSPNPLELESHHQMVSEIARTGAILGALIDGDGDRVLFFDETGRVIESYFTGALIAAFLLKKNPSKAVVYDLISSNVFPEEIAAAGGIPVRSKVGYTNLYDKMVQTNAIFGNETSGHLYFLVQDSFYTESAIYGLGIMLNLLLDGDKVISKLVEPLRNQYVQQEEINVSTIGKDPELALRRVCRAFQDGHNDYLDGLSIRYEDFWFNIRMSNTEPVLRLRVEAVKYKVLSDVTKRVLNILGLEK